MNSDYVFKGRSQLALQTPDWAKYGSAGAAPVASAAAPSGDFAAAVDAHDAAYDAAKSATHSAKHTVSKAAAKTPQRYLAAEAETERLNRMSSSPARIVEDDAENAQPVVPSKDGTEQTANNEIGEDGSLYPDRNKASAAKMNVANHSGSNKKTIGPDVDNVDYTFEDFLDTINPLQQIPVVNMIYRQLTGDKISGVAQVMGSALFWGPTGIVTGAVDAIFEQEKGGDMGETIMASLLGTETPNAKNLPSNQKNSVAPDTMLAEAKPAAPAKTKVAAHAAAPSAKVAASQPSPLPTGQKQPFGGIMGNEQPAPVPHLADDANAMRADAAQAANASDSDDAGDDEAANQNVSAENVAQATAPSAKPIIKPTAHGPIEADGHKMYSLAGIVRHPSVPSNMPPREVPDTRLKNYGKMTASAVKPTPDASSLLGLQKPAAAIAATPNLDDAELPETRLPDPGFSAPLNMGDMKTPSGNPIPSQLIQDMMLLNMQKYQNDLKNGALRGSSVDVNG